MLLVFGAPCQHDLLAGREHGRTIPLADISCALRQWFLGRFQPLSKCSAEPIQCCLLSLGSDMQRREFIKVVAGLTVALPVAVRAQQSERMRRIGVLLAATADDVEFQAWVGAFLQGLQQSGWSIGQNVRIDTRWATSNAAGIHKHAAELAALAPDVILAHGASTVGPLLQATHTVPIVSPVFGDPVGAGFVDSLAHPGGNVTGFMSFEYGMAVKWLELLKEIVPSVTRAAVLRDPSQGSGTSQFAAIQAVAPSLRVEVNPVNVRDPADLERAIAAFARSPNGGLIVTAGATASFIAS